ncbi:MAG: 3-hydroxyacyl-ACP dehydratase FabZ family protein [Planctomycetota bacterium]
MAPSALLFDISNACFDTPLLSIEQIEAINPHRGNMRLLDGVAYESDDRTDLVAYKEIGDDEFWCDGHIPGRPIFPGVLMIETAAQCASLQAQRIMHDHAFGFIGFVGVNNVKFRGQVVPGDRLVMLSKAIEAKPRRCKTLAQGLVDGRVVFEGQITGMPI